MITPTLERYEFKHKNISVWVEIDYITQRISLTEKDGRKKKWLFAERGTKYMQGWSDILTAMDKAVEHAANRLQAYQERKEDEFALMLYEVSEKVAPIEH